VGGGEFWRRADIKQFGGLPGGNELVKLAGRDGRFGLRCVHNRDMKI
jgi:hypothetical protein